MKKFYFVFCKDSLLLERKADGSHTIPLSEEPPTEVKPWTTMLNITPLGETEVKAYQIDAPVTDDDRFEMCPLRSSYYHLPEALYLKAGKCAELLYWHQNTKFCGVCGGQMKFHTDISKRCEQCGKEVWPQLATAIIVLIHKGKDEVLLARGRNFKSDFYGLIAGFVETGETLEEAVCREVMEETGIRIKNISYFGSQPWPYPSGLMVGFNADYESGELHIQLEELKKAGWFHRDNLPKLPEKLSIARRLIDDWLENS
jgi:NAD+ diphosphatase